MAWTRIKVPLIVSTAVLLALGTATLTWQRLSSTRPAPIDFQGFWEGVVPTEANLRIVLKVSKSPDGTYSATLDSVDQGAKDIPVSDFSSANRVVKIEMKS